MRAALTVTPRFCFAFLLFFIALLAGAPPAHALDTADVAQRIVSGTNKLRQQQDRPQVKANAQLKDAALEFARFMSNTDKYGHTADGRRPEERAQQHGYDFCMLSENIAYQFSSEGFRADDLAQKFLQGWERSPGHRKNMLHPDVTEIGVAVAHSEKSGNYYAVQMFGRPQAASIKFEIENQARAAISYTLNDKSFSLDPNSTRTHRQCGSMKLEITSPEGEKQAALTPANGDRFVIIKKGSGIQVQKK